ncbi:ligand-gated ion channel [Lithospermum erythrorhizon]|uniref:Ligand-gated ion channel n=1 Tax=Lithospermum erythrorhizon TaxID=34254 RepID=A0AAV3QB16_LITER
MESFELQMANQEDHHQYSPNHYSTDEDYDIIEEGNQEDEDEDEDEEERENSNNNNNPQEINSKFIGLRYKNWSFLGKVLDPRVPWIQEWNRVFLLVCATGLFVDPLFFYALSISDNCMCLFVDGWFAVTVTVLRCMTDALHFWNIWLQLKVNKRHFAMYANETSRLHDVSAESVALRYLKARRGFLLDLFVILPLPQVSYLLSLVELYPILIRVKSSTC